IDLRERADEHRLPGGHVAGSLVRLKGCLDISRGRLQVAHGAVQVGGAGGDPQALRQNSSCSLEITASQVELRESNVTVEEPRLLPNRVLIARERSIEVASPGSKIGQGQGYLTGKRGRDRAKRFLV